MSVRRAVALVAIGMMSATGSAAAADTITRTPHAIGQFAQDGRRLAWAFPRCGEVQVHSLRTDRTKTVSELRCGTQESFWVDGLALGGSRALWRTLFDFPCTRFIGRVYTATATSSQRRIDTHENCSYFAADGDGTALIFSGEGRTFRVTDSGERMRLQGASGATNIAVADGRVALAGIPSGGVEIRDARSGALRSSFTPADQIRSLALASNRVALLLRDDAGNKRIEWYDLDGTLLGDVSVGDKAGGLDMAGPRVVYRTGRPVHVLDTRTEERPIVARPRGTTIGLSIEGRRVAWAMNIEGEGVVKRVIVPAG